MATPLHGKDGTVTFANGNVVNVFSWNATMTTRQSEVSVFGASTVARINGLEDISGSFSVYNDGAQGVTSESGTTGTIVLTAVTGDTITVTTSINVESSDVSSDVDGAVVTTFNFVGNGGAIVFA